MVSLKNTSSFSAIKHRNLSRVVTLYSPVLAGFNANEVVGKTKEILDNYDIPKGVSFKFTGEMEKQEENMAFLSIALLTAIGLIMLLLVFQFYIIG